MNDQLRLSDADRDQAAAALADHYAEGRLSTDEHAERLDRVWAARTRGDLRPIFRDLPAPGRPPSLRATYGSPWSSRAGRHRTFPAPLLLVVGALLALTVVTHLPFVMIGILAIVLLTRRRHHARWRCAGQTGPLGKW